MTTYHDARERARALYEATIQAAEAAEEFVAADDVTSETPGFDPAQAAARYTAACEGLWAAVRHLRAVRG